MTKGKSTVLGLRISEADQERIREAADARGQNVSEYVRSIVEASIAPATVRTGHRSAHTSAADNLADGVGAGWENGGQSIFMSNRRTGPA